MSPGDQDQVRSALDADFEALRDALAARLGRPEAEVGSWLNEDARVVRDLHRRNARLGERAIRLRERL